MNSILVLCLGLVVGWLACYWRLRQERTLAASAREMAAQAAMAAAARQLESSALAAETRLLEERASATERLRVATETSKQLQDEIERLEAQLQRNADELEAAEARASRLSETSSRARLEWEQSVAESAAALGSGRVHAGRLNDGLQELLKVHKAFDRWHAAIDILLQNNDDMHRQNQRFAQIVRQMTIVTLNASIEAARAGESGRGFAVVSEEMRSLARNAHQLSSEFSKSLHHNDLITTATFQDIQAGGKLIIGALVSLEQENSRSLDALNAGAVAT